MNPWSEKLGCEVNVCQAKVCDKERMQTCALRKAWQDRVAVLRIKRNRLKHNSKYLKEIDKQLEGMGVPNDRGQAEAQRED